MRAKVMWVWLVCVLFGASVASAGAIDLTFNNSFQRNPTGSANVVNDISGIPEMPLVGDYLGDRVTVKLGAKIYDAANTGTPPSPDDPLDTGLGLSGVLIAGGGGGGGGAGLVWHYGGEDYSGASKIALWDYNQAAARVRLTGLKSAATFQVSGIGSALDWTPIPGDLVGKTGDWGLIMFISAHPAQGNISGTATITPRAVPVDFRGYANDAAITADIVTNFTGTGIAGLVGYLTTAANNAKGLEYDPTTGNFWIAHNTSTIELRDGAGGLIDSLDISTIPGISNPPGASGQTSFDIDYCAQADRTLLLLRRNAGQDWSGGKTNESVCYNFSLPAPVIPEPAGLGLVGLALLGLRRRRS